MTAWLKIGALVGSIGIGWWLGSGMKQAQWDRAENKALNAQIALRIDAEQERDVSTAKTRKALLRLSEAETESVRLSDELQTEINRAPVVRTVRIETPADCPVVECAVPDVSLHFRLFNCGINNSCEAVPDAGIPDHGDGGVR